MVGRVSGAAPRPLSFIRFYISIFEYSKKRYLLLTHHRIDKQIEVIALCLFHFHLFFSGGGDSITRVSTMDKTGPRVSCLLINGPFQSHEPLEPFPWQFPLCKHPGHCMYMYRPLRILFIFLQIVSFGHLYAAAWCTSSKSKGSFRRCFSFFSFPSHHDGEVFALTHSTDT